MKGNTKSTSKLLLLSFTILIGGFMGLRAQEVEKKPEAPTKIKIIKIINGDTTIIEREGYGEAMKFDSHGHHHPHRHHGPHHFEHSQLQHGHRKMDSFHEERVMKCFPDSLKEKKIKEVILIHENGDTTKLDPLQLCHKTPMIHHEIRREEMMMEKGKHKNMKKMPKPDMKMSIDVYPNPSKGVFHIKGVSSEKELEITVLDINGKEILKKNMEISENFQTQIDLSGMAKGIYTLVIKTASETEISKINLD